MNRSGHNIRPSARAGGFTLFAFLLATTALALAAYIAISELGKYRARAQRDQFVTDLREIAAAFDAYRAQKNTWPPATNPDIRTPLGMESALTATRWLAGPPFGGTYEWQIEIPPRPAPVPALTAEDLANKPAADVSPSTSAVTNVTGIIAITAFAPKTPLALTSKDLLYIDGKLDDGNLATGRFRTGFNGWPVYQVGPSP